MRANIELVTVDDVKEFTNLVKTVVKDVRIIGKDENGNNWNLSAKSLFGNLMLANRVQDKDKVSMLDWNTIAVECEDDIYGLISKFVKGGVLEV